MFTSGFSKAASSVLQVAKKLGMQPASAVKIKAGVSPAALKKAFGPGPATTDISQKAIKTVPQPSAPMAAPAAPPSSAPKPPVQGVQHATRHVNKLNYASLTEAPSAPAAPKKGFLARLFG